MNKFVLPLIFMTQILYSADPCPNCKMEIILDDVSGGLSTTLLDYKIGKQFSPNMRNVFIDNGKIEQIKGFNQVGSTSTLQSGKFMFTFVKESGDTEFLVSDSSVMLSTKDFRTYVMVSSGINTSGNLDCAQFRNKVWCTNGLDAVFTWDGSVRTVLNGTLGTPNVPKGKYIEIDQERIWLGGTSGNGSSLDWCDVKSTNGVAIAPDNFLAWPLTNQLSIGQGDGQLITALWMYGGQLHISKERSIYIRYGTNSTNYFARKVESNVGVISNDSISILDGFTYFKGQGGGYKWSGKAERLTDNMIPDMQAVINPSNKIVRNSWEIQSDFARGNFAYGSTATVGALTISVIDKNITGSAGAFLSTMIIAGLSDDATSYGPVRLNFTSQIENSYIGFVRRIDTGLTRVQKTGSDPNQIPNARITIYNLNLNTSTSAVVTIGNFIGASDPFLFANQHPLFSGAEINQSSFGIKVERINDGAAIDNISITLSEVIFRLTPATTVQFVSEVSTLATVTAWGNFDSVRNANGGSVNYFLKTATSSVNITTRTWSAIVPGVRIPAPTIENYVQWATTITSISSFTSVSYIDNVTIDHVEGSGNSDRPFAIDWKNRYWLAVATDTSGNFSTIYVKSIITNKNPDAWMPIEGINIRSFCKDGTTTLYAGAASTGVFYRLDNGTNFNGSPIRAFYETPSTYFGDPFTEKNLFEYLLIADKGSGNNLKLGFAADNADFTDTSYSMDGSGRLARNIQKVNSTGRFFRWRFLNDELDKDLTPLNFAVIYEPTSIRKGKSD